MVLMLRKLNTVGSCGSVLRNFERPPAYSPCCNGAYRTYNSLLGPLSTLRHTENILENSSSSVHTKSFRLRPTFRLSSYPRGFSASSAVKINKAAYDRLRLDPNALRAYLNKNSEHSKRFRDTDSEARQRQNKLKLQRHANLAETQEDYTRFRRLHTWIYGYS
jgi:hypothetical protein